MHPNPAFRQETRKAHLDFVAQTGFGMLCATVDAQQPPLLAHVPFLLNQDRARVALHLARANPIVKTRIERLPATIAVQGPHGYISPDWYDTDDQVPTWNYVAVHLRGMLVRLDQSDIRQVVDEVSDHFEGLIPDKPPWSIDKMPADVLEKMLIQIVPYRFDIEAVEGTWKLNQNKPQSARHHAAKRVAVSSLGQDTPTLAALMMKDQSD